MNFSTWGSTGGWIPNSNMIIMKKACSAIKIMAGNLWFTIKEGFNFPNASCPIQMVI